MQQSYKAASFSLVGMWETYMILATIQYNTMFSDHKYWSVVEICMWNPQKTLRPL